ncbi:MAG TPA: M28 family peptidase [Gemmatimonadales bacterium]|nr:M28 family peptidase [Gemmatimonadales bacterium]
MRLILLLLLGLLPACESSPPPKFDGQAAFHYLEQQVAFGPRIPGSPGHRAEAAWLDSLLRQRADTLVVQSWTHVTARGDSLHLTNFLARFNPRAQKRLLFLAHWDTRPISDNPSYQGNRNQPVPGANDGASGVALLLELADVYHRHPPRIGVDLLFDDGEDYGDFKDQSQADVLIGSRYYAAHLPPGPMPLFAVLFDMIGDKDLRILQEGNSLLGAPEVVDLVWQAARAAGHGNVFIATPGVTLTDDHVELQKVGIRAIDVVDFDYGPDNSYWHTPNDTIDKVSAASLQIVGDVATMLVQRQ